MAGEDRIVKVIITIEDSETIRTIEIPKAREIDVYYSPQPTSLEDRPLSRGEFTSGWQIRGMADFDYESNRLIITSSRPKSTKKVTTDFSVPRDTVSEYWANHTTVTGDHEAWEKAYAESGARFDLMLEKYKQEVISDFVKELHNVWVQKET